MKAYRKGPRPEDIGTLGNDLALCLQGPSPLKLFPMARWSQWFCCSVALLKCFAMINAILGGQLSLHPASRNCTLSILKRPLFCPEQGNDVRGFFPGRGTLGDPSEECL